MSHFAVLVIGDGPEEQLEPYYEELKVEFQVDEDYDVDENTGKKGYWFNPNAKWDWYLLGGRWTGYFKAKPNAKGISGEPGIFTEKAPEGRIDSGLKSEIDFEGMRLEAMNSAIERYKKVEDLMGGKIIQPKRSWQELCDDMSIPTAEDRRRIFNSQPEVKKFKQEEIVLLLGPFASISEFKGTVDEYARRAYNNAISTFAVVKDGGWYEKGEMGWFGFSKNEMDQDEWNEEFNKLIDSCPDDTLFSLYDCHI